MSIQPLGYSPYPTLTGLSVRSRLLRYGVAVSAVGLSTLLGLYLRPYSYTTPFLFFYPAVILAVWIGGLKPGLLATALASVSANFFFLAPYNAFSKDIANLLRTFFFGLTFATICWFADLARKHLHSLISVQSELLDMSFDPIIVRDAEDRIIYWNQGAERLYGWSKDEALGQRPNTLLQTVFPMPLDEVAAEFQKSGRWNDEVIHTKRDGSKIVVATQWTLKVESAKQVAVLEANRDITERKRLEQDLIAAKELAEKTLAQFRANIDSMSEGMYVVDTDGKRLLTNPAYFHIHGFDPGGSPDAISPLLEHYDLNDKLIPAEDWSVSRALRGEIVVQRQQRVRRIDTGTEVIVMVNATPVRDSSGEVIMAVVTVEDITTMKRAEESLRTSDKLAAVGKMAGTLAHEINNPLAAIKDLVYLLSQNQKLDQNGREFVQLVDKELDRIQHIVANTLSFYRDSGLPVRVNLSQVLDSVLTLDARKIERKQLQVSKRIEANVPVMGFPGELRQVFLNLVTNAIEATPDRGKLRIHLFPSWQWQKEEVRGVRMVIADNGPGISPEHRSKLFRPFFTTKGEQGTGLGLWVSQGIVRKHQGELRLRTSTRFGRSGTCFSVFLPIELPETKLKETTDAKLAS
jgi:PAS domain S-box-containing protein